MLIKKIKKKQQQQQETIRDRERESERRWKRSICEHKEMVNVWRRSDRSHGSKN